LYMDHDLLEGFTGCCSSGILSGTVSLLFSAICSVISTLQIWKLATRHFVRIFLKRFGSNRTASDLSRKSLRRWRVTVAEFTRCPFPIVVGIMLRGRRSPGVMV